MADERELGAAERRTRSDGRGDDRRDVALGGDVALSDERRAGERRDRRAGRGRRATDALPRRMPAPAADSDRAEPHVAIISGLSGAGKTITSKLFEDLGYVVVDNLPAELLPSLAELVAREPERFQRVALVLDVRSGDAPLAFGAVVGALEGRAMRPQVFFLEARDDVLIRRYSETRHRHPLQGQRGIEGSIADERRLLREVRDQADVIIDTSQLSARELKERIFSALGPDEQPGRIAIQLISFGYKYGLPLESDIVFDVRFMENPFYHADLKPLSGLTEPVKRFVLEQPMAQRFLDFVSEFLDFAVPAYVEEGKARLTIGVGCTGGYHRSITIAEAIAAGLRERNYGPVSVWHRELEGAEPLPAAVAAASAGD